MPNSTIFYDAVIVGGGMIGATTALGLAQAGWSVAVIERQKPADFLVDSDPDIRVSAVGCSAVGLLRRLQVWDNILKMRATPYRRLVVWEWEQAKVIFDTTSVSLPELGFMVENKVLQLGLWQQCMTMPALALFCPNSLVRMERQKNDWILELKEGQQLRTALVIGADGAYSTVRQQAGIGVTGWQYQQSCLLLTIKSQQSQQDVSWQQFTPQGARALLPLFGPWACLVWYDDPDRIKQLQAMPLNQLNQAVFASFPDILDELGEIDIKATASFPIIRQHAQCYFKQGTVLLGDAAHTINPLAGQGLNLGYRDVDALLEVLISARYQGEVYQSDSVLSRYQQRRKWDNMVMQTAMDAFYQGFSNDLIPIKTVRNLLLMVVQRSEKLKTGLLKYAMGL